MNYDTKSRKCHRRPYKQLEPLEIEVSIRFQVVSPSEDTFHECGIKDSRAEEFVNAPDSVIMSTLAEVSVSSCHSKDGGGRAHMTIGPDVPPRLI